ncbi:MAG: HAMP domain-containing protein [Anaerolineae bacterium]|nr:HAMP domain-containing protein [Anaerolineae bacterium]
MPILRRLNLLPKLILLFISIGLAPLLMVSGINGLLSADLLRNNVIIEERAHLQNIAENITRFFDTAQSDILILANSTSMKALAQAIAQSRSLVLQQTREAVEADFITLVEGRMIADQRIYQQVRFLTADGFEFVRVDNLATGIRPARGFNLNSRSNRDYFTVPNRLEKGDIYISRAELVEEFGRIQTPHTPVIRYSTPIYNGDTFVGVLVTDVQIGGFFPLVNNTLSPDTLSFLVDDDGYYLIHPDPNKLYGRDLRTGERLHRDFPRFQVVVAANTEGVTDLDTHLAVYRRIIPAGEPDFYWTLVSLRPTASVLGFISRQLWTVLGGVVVVGLIVSFIAIFLARGISHPITELTKQAQALAQGDFSQRISVRQHDEIGNLAQTFNSMSAQLQDFIATLEKRVQERTHDLEKVTEQAQTAAQQAEQANAVKTQFLASMSHELRTPLSAILGFAQIMGNDSQLSREKQQNIQMILKNGAHLLRLIEDILEMSKIEAGQNHLSLTHFDLLDSLDSLWALFKIRAESQNLTILFQYAENIPQYIIADEVKLRQILINLMSNAIKYTDKGHVMVRVSAPQPTRLKFEVEDTGCGIDPDELDDLFSPFVRGKQHRNSIIGGTGLGLPISRQFAILMGGDITVKSTVGAGSCFSFEIDVEPIATMTPPAKTHPPKAIIPPTTHQQEFTILIIEDDWESRALLTRLLESVGFAVLEATNHEEALDFIAHSHPQLIFMDIQLATTDSDNLVGQVRDNPLTHHIPIIGMTTRFQIGHDYHLFENGFNDTLHKPFLAHDVFAKIEHYTPVTFRYEVELLPNNTAPKLDATLFGRVETRWLRLFHHQIMAARQTTALSLLDEIEAQHPQLVSILRQLIQSYQYEVMIDCINEVI